MKLWSNKFNSIPNSISNNLLSSVKSDKRMYLQDILGTIAHIKMLGKSDIISYEDSEKLRKNLLELLHDIQTGIISLENSDDDIHSFIEQNMILRLGDLGKKINVGRSHAEQEMLDLRMYLRDEANVIVEYLLSLEHTLLGLSKEHIDTIMPGYTHLQRTQPITLAHYYLAYFQMFRRDIERINDSLKRINIMPLGSGLLAGSTLPIDRHFVAADLGFESISENSIDAVSDQDFIIELASSLSLIMLHLSRFCEEIVLWSTSEFDFIDLSDASCATHDNLPYKKNASVAELIRGKTGRVYGNLVNLLTTMKALPLAYQSDFHENKESIFDTLETIRICLPSFTNMLSSIHINTDSMRSAANEGHYNAPEVIEYLVMNGLPRNEAYNVACNLVLYCHNNKKTLLDLTIDEYIHFSPVFEDDIYNSISLEKCVSAKSIPGGSSKDAVLISIQHAEKFLHNLQ